MKERNNEEGETRKKEKSKDMVRRLEVKDSGSEGTTTKEYDENARRPATENTLSSNQKSPSLFLSIYSALICGRSMSPVSVVLLDDRFLTTIESLLASGTS
jgi:hypothetical protein